MQAPDPLALVVNLARPNALVLVERVRVWGAAHGIGLVRADMGFGCPPGDEPAYPLSEIGGRCAAVVVLGGDGSILRAAPVVAPLEIPLVAVNTGKFGFLATAESVEMERLLDDLCAGRLRQERRALLQATCESVPLQVLALNDVVLHRVEATRVVEYEVYIGDSLVSRFSADGVCVATPTGSTAYSLSAGGPVLHPGVDAVIITPLCAHTLAMRPMVVSNRERITLRVLSRDAAVHVLIDGRVASILQHDQDVVVTRSRHKVRLLRRVDRPFYAVLRQKLGWGGAVEE